MIVKEYKKFCDVRKLHDELVGAGFNVIGVACNSDEKLNYTTAVYLDDKETKDPSEIVKLI